MNKSLVLFLSVMLGSVITLLTSMRSPVTEESYIYQSVENDSIEPFLVETKSTIRLFRDMDNYSSVIQYIPAEEVVEVFEEIDDYYSASYNSNKGYVLVNKVKPLNFSLQSGQQVSANKGINNTDRLTYLQGKYDSKTAMALYKRGIWKGMSTKMVIDSWGRPLKTDRYMNSDPRIEQWTYKGHILHFEGGKLTDWE